MWMKSSECLPLVFLQSCKRFFGRYTVIMDIVSAVEYGGTNQTKTLKLLNKHFASELHTLFRNNIRMTATPNSLFALSITKNTKFIQVLLSLFKQ